MAYQGNFRLGDTIDFKFTTTQSTGAPFTLAGSPSLAAYPSVVGSAPSTTEITAGLTLTVDFDSKTGLNHARIVATSGNGFVANANYDVVIAAGTVNSVSVANYVVGSFSLENRAMSVIGYVRKNTAFPNYTFFLTDSTTHAPKTGVTVTAQRKIDSGSFASCTNSATEVGNGWYTIDLSAADLNGRVISLRLTGTGTDDRNIQIITFD